MGDTGEGGVGVSGRRITLEADGFTITCTRCGNKCRPGSECACIEKRKFLQAYVVNHDQPDLSTMIDYGEVFYLADEAANEWDRIEDLCREQATQLGCIRRAGIKTAYTPKKGGTK